MTADYMGINRPYWDEITELHLRSPFYRTEAFRRGEIILDPIVRDGIGDVAGKRLLHLQCHFGLDTLSLARLGAEVTGLDFSPAAINAARALSEETGVPGTFVQADVLHPPPGLTGFDIVFASWGAICWIPDMAGWMQVAAGALRPGGRLYLAEGHPAMLMLDELAGSDAPLTVRYPYDAPEPLHQEQQGDYAEPGVTLQAHRNVLWLHGLGRILNAAIGAGFRIDRLEELDRIPWQGLPQLVPADDHYWTLPPGTPFVPLAFALSATLDRPPAV